MHKHTSQLRGPGSGQHHAANRGPVRRWNSFHGGGSVGGGASNFNDTVGNGNLPPGMITKAPQEPFRAVPKAVQALRSESVDRSHRAQPPPPPAFPRRRFSVWWVWKFEFGICFFVSSFIFTFLKNEAKFRARYWKVSVFVSHEINEFGNVWRISFTLLRSHA